MSRPTAKPALAKAPTRVHPVAPPSVASVERTGPGKPGLAQVDEARVMHSARIPFELRRDLKRHAVDVGRTLEEVTELALQEYLEHHRYEA